MRFFIHAKSSSQMLNTFEKKQKQKKRNVIFYKDNI